jgi:hypothetical protein
MIGLRGGCGCCCLPERRPLLCLRWPISTGVLHIAAGLGLLGQRWKCKLGKYGLLESPSLHLEIGLAVI